MLVKINGEDVEIKEDSTIKEAIDLSGAPYTSGSILCLIKGQKEFEKNISKYKIRTPKGSIIIEMTDNKEAKPLIKLWKDQYIDFKNSNIRWITGNEVAIGPITTNLEPTHDEFRYEDGEVILSLSGFSNESTHLIIIKDEYSNTFGVPKFNRGVLGKVIGGKRTLNLLTEKDTILDIEPIIERSTTSDSSMVSDLNIVLKEGNQLFTYVSIKPNENSPETVEHLFSLIEKNKLKVDYDSNSFLGFYGLEGLSKPTQYQTPRERGTVTVRTDGNGIGKVYIYREDRVFAPSHTTVGKVVKGMELIDIAKNGEFITIQSEPKRIMTLATSQKDAEEFLNLVNVKQIREGVIDDDAFIVSQEPQSTMEILNLGEVKTKGIKHDDLTFIELFDKAPRSEWYFKKLTGLVEKPVGQLKVHFAFPGMKLTMFEGDNKESKGLIPENNPENCVRSGIIGITNMARKNVGLIGVRFEDNDEFGPTGEPFQGTNVVGRIISDLKHIEKLKEGDILYVRESLHES